MPITFAFFLSGAAALILQVLWTRMMGHVLGASALAVSTVLTVFMGGLALGSHLGGRWAPRVQRPLLVFAVLEAGVGLYGLMVPAMLESLPYLQVGLSGLLGEGRWGHALVRFFLATLVLLPPTTAMGATLPLLAEAAVGRLRRIAETTGGLYAANTLGAVVGALASGFWLIPTFGISTTVLVAAGVDLAVAGGVVLAFRWGRDGFLTEPRNPPETHALYEDAEALRIEATPRERHRALWVFALSGASAMVLEVLWTRAVGVVIGASTYAFTLILTTFLIGLAGGAGVASRRVERTFDPLRVLARVEIAAGLATLLAALVIDRLPLWLHEFTRDESLSHAGLYATHFFLTAAVTLPATLALGAVMPLVLAVVAPRGEVRAGPVVGQAYALNTLGAILGSFSGGFLVLPGLGVERGLEFAALGSAMLGLYLLRDRWRRAGPEALLVAVIAAVAVAGPRWDVERWTAGMFRFYLARDVYRYGWSSSTEVIHHRDGVATTVTVGRYPGRSDDRGVVLKVNGKVDASDIGDMPTQVLSGLLPVLLHPDPKDALVIGYGSGVTPGALLQSELRSMAVAEVESAVYEAANIHFAHVNHRPFEDPRARLVVDDGRNYLLTSRQEYDLIISEPSNPWMSGAASLFTLEFFEIAKRRLRPQGVFLQWLQLYELSPESIHTLVRTFHAAFPYILIFTPDPHSNDTFLLGSAEPLRVARDRVQAVLSNPKLARELERARVQVPEDLIGLFFLDQAGLPEVVGKGPLNTDDNALIEFAAPRDLLEFGTRDAHVPFRDRARGRRRDLVRGEAFVGFPDDGRALVMRADRLLRQGRRADARDHLEAARGKGQDVEGPLAVLDALEGPDDQPVVVATPSVRGHRAYAEAVVAMLQGDDRQALALVEADEDPRWIEEPGHALLRAYLKYREAETFEALDIFRRIAEEEGFVADHPEVLFYAARAHAERHEWGAAVELMERWEWARASLELEAQPGPSPELNPQSP